MGKRRGNNEGCIRERKDGRWLVEIQTGIKADGRPKKIYKYTKTQAEAVAALHKLQGELMVGVDRAKGNIKVGEWCFTWLSKYKKKLAASTRTSYETNLRVHINQYIGGVALNKLTSYQIQHMLDSIYNNGENSTSLFIKVYNVLNGALKKAVSLGMIAKNPAEEVEFPKDSKKNIRVLSINEQKAFIQALKTEESRPLFMTYLYTGARLGELPPLTWNDIDLDERSINIRRKAIIIHNYYSEDKKTVQEVQDFCKSVSSKRKIIITPLLVDILRQHKDKQKEYTKSLGKEWSDDQLVFPTVNGTIPYTRNIQEKFDRIMGKLGLEGVTVHSLRHTYATRLFEANVDIKIVSEQLGHKNVKITYDTYVHVMPNKKLNEIDKLSMLDNLIV